MSASIKLDLMGSRILAEHRHGVWRLFEFDPLGEPIPARIVLPDFVGEADIEDYLRRLFPFQGKAGRAVVKRLDP
jgi:hypothetical protein